MSKTKSLRTGSWTTLKKLAKEMFSLRFYRKAFFYLLRRNKLKRGKQEWRKTDHVFSMERDWMISDYPTFCNDCAKSGIEILRNKYLNKKLV